MARFDFINGFNVRPVGFQQFLAAGLVTAQVLTPPTKDLANVAVIQCVGQDVRWRDDGTAPTAAIGTLLPAGQTLEYNGDLAQFQVIRTGAASEVNITYYRLGEQ